MQRTVAPASESVKLKLGEVTLLGFVGFAVIDGAGGGVRSIVHVYVVFALTLPTVSFAWTRNVCEPAARPA